MESDCDNLVSESKCKDAPKSAIGGTVKEIDILCNSFQDSLFMKVN